MGESSYCPIRSGSNRGRNSGVRKIMALSQQEKIFAADVSKLLHAEKPAEAARWVADVCKIKLSEKQSQDPLRATPILQSYLHNLLEADGLVEAARLLWSPTQFNPEPQCARDVWKLFDEASTGLIMGGAKLSKSFSMGVRLFLEWVRDPEYTSIRVLGPSENHLEENLFSHLVSLHNHATLPMPGTIGDLFIGLNRRDQMSSIRGVIIPKGNVKKAGRLQGGHRRPRPVPHPIFGPLSRIFIFLDDFETTRRGI